MLIVCFHFEHSSSGLEDSAGLVSSEFVNVICSFAWLPVFIPSMYYFIFDLSSAASMSFLWNTNFMFFLSLFFSLQLDPVRSSSVISRLGQSSTPARHPVILPGKSRLARLILNHAHNKVHLGEEWTLSVIRQ